MCIHFSDFKWLLIRIFLSLFASSVAQNKLVYSYSHGLSTAPFIGDTIGQRLDWATETFPEREAYVCCEDKNRATFAEFREEVHVQW